MKNVNLGDVVYIKIPVTVEEIHQEWGNYSGVEEWITVSDDYGNTFDIDDWDAE